MSRCTASFSRSSVSYDNRGGQGSKGNLLDSYSPGLAFSLVTRSSIAARQIEPVDSPLSRQRRSPVAQVCRHCYRQTPHGQRFKPKTITVDTAPLFKALGSDETSSIASWQHHPVHVSQSTGWPSREGMPARVTTLLIAPPVSMPDGRRGMLPNAPDQPVKKQSKWSPEEDALIIELRGSGMKWEDISKRLPGRSAISCRLHYQNYLERRSEWDEDRKNKLARLYERYVCLITRLQSSTGSTSPHQHYP